MNRSGTPITDVVQHNWEAISRLKKNNKLGGKEEEKIISGACRPSHVKHSMCWLGSPFQDSGGIEGARILPRTEI